MRTTAAGPRALPQPRGTSGAESVTSSPLGGSAGSGRVKFFTRRHFYFPRAPPPPSPPPRFASPRPLGRAPRASLSAVRAPEGLSGGQSGSGAQRSGGRTSPPPRESRSPSSSRTKKAPLTPSGRGVKVSPSHVPPQRSAARCPRRWDPPGPGPSRSLAPAQRLISRETDTTVLGRERPALCGREPCLFERHLTQRATNWTRASA